MAISLGLNDDMIQTFERYEKFSNGKVADSFKSSFLGDYASCNMKSSILDGKKNISIYNIDIGKK